MKYWKLSLLGIAAVAAILFGGLAAWATGLIPGDSPVAVAQQSAARPTLEWFGHSFFRITTLDGRVILLNPWTTNPDSTMTLDNITKADYILVPDGHRDEQGEAIEIAQKTGAKIIAGGFELGSWFIQKGVPQAQVVRSNPGNWHDLGNVVVRVVSSVHGSGLPSPTIENPYGGPAAGFFITLENGFTIYFAGSTAATMDMQLWGATFKPDLAILPLNNARDPVDVAQMVRLLSKDNPNLKEVIPHHMRVQPAPGDTTIAQMESAIRALSGSPVRVIRLQRGQIVQLGNSAGVLPPP